MNNDNNINEYMKFLISLTLMLMRERTGPTVVIALVVGLVYDYFSISFFHKHAWIINAR